VEKKESDVARRTPKEDKKSRGDCFLLGFFLCEIVAALYIRWQMSEAPASLPSHGRIP
jgi:hypothetical protein